VSAARRPPLPVDDEWAERIAAAAPELTPEQEALLAPLVRPVVPAKGGSQQRERRAA
jgi:hypothetical protein